jgi:hypothetical protein
MPPAETRLHLVPRAPGAGEERSGSHEDVGLTSFLLLVASVPLASAAAGIGRWDATTLGLGTLGVLFAGRELGALVASRWRSGRHP